MSLMRRIFLAIHASSALQAEAIAWQANYERLPVRWLKGHNLHLTLIPPWYESDIEKVKSKIEKAGNTVRPFAIRFERVTYGPNPRSPRLIWAEGRTPREMEDLKSKIENLLRQQPAASQERGEPRLGGPRRENRPFRLHLTLARFHPEDFSQFPLKHLDSPVDWRNEVKSFVLMESHLAPGGAEYEILETYSLKPGT